MQAAVLAVLAGPEQLQAALAVLYIAGLVVGAVCASSVLQNTAQLLWEASERQRQRAKGGKPASNVVQAREEEKKLKQTAVATVAGALVVHAADQILQSAVQLLLGATGLHLPEALRSMLHIAEQGFPLAKVFTASMLGSGFVKAIWTRIQRREALKQRSKAIAAQRDAAPAETGLLQAAPGASAQQLLARSGAAQTAAANSASTAVPGGLSNQPTARRLLEASVHSVSFSARMTVQDPQSMLAASASRGDELPLSAYILKAAAQAERKVPELSARWNAKFAQANYPVFSSVAVPGPSGLVQLTVKNGDVKTPTGIAAEFKELTGRAAEGKLLREQAMGSPVVIFDLDSHDASQFAGIAPPKASGHTPCFRLAAGRAPTAAAVLGIVCRVVTAVAAGTWCAVVAEQALANSALLAAPPPPPPLLSTAAS
ncbi:hypothetical protein ABPG77_005066 [Micractinium sp. CCAP 211/92]